MRGRRSDDKECRRAVMVRMVIILKCTLDGMKDEAMEESSEMNEGVASIDTHR